ncbi:protein-disulfide reductase DsbD N-terminal domain-containing protein [Luminiphilus sp.]|nr:protein-disulfide reductase DsbD N-terminal domain-containing protein [Luminiphilus sp.]
MVRFALKDGLHLYGEPVPTGLTATQVTILGPKDLQCLPARYPPTTPLYHETMDVNLNVWSDEVTIVVPFYPAGDLATEAVAPATTSASIDFEVRYQACNETECLLPRTERFSIDLPLDVVDVPSLSIHRGHGQREGNYDSTPAMRRLLWRKIRTNPLRLLKLMWKTQQLKRSARKGHDG